MADDRLSIERLYAETRADIRATDDISFKLMGLVPLVSGGAFLTFFLQEALAAKAGILAALGLFAALITLGIFRWELRNIQRCDWLRRCAEALEGPIAAETQLPRQPTPPHHIGKTEAEKWIYSVTIIAWLVIPRLISPLGGAPWFRSLYSVTAVLILLFTGLSAFATVRVRTRDEVIRSAA